MIFFGNKSIFTLLYAFSQSKRCENSAFFKYLSFLAVRSVYEEIGPSDVARGTRICNLYLHLFRY